MDELCGSIRVEQLEVFARVGITAKERANPQRVTLSLTAWPKDAFDRLNDDIGRTVNYSALAVAARDFIQGRQPNLIETLASELASHLLQQFPVRKIEIELRKFVLPEAKYVAVTVSRLAAPS